MEIRTENNNDVDTDGGNTALSSNATGNLDDESSSITISIDETSMSSSQVPIEKLPVIPAVGTFVGERTKAKAMAATLAQLWGLQYVVEEHVAMTTSYSSDGRSRKRKRYASGRGSNPRRKRGGGHRQAWLI